MKTSFSFCTLLGLSIYVLLFFVVGPAPHVSISLSITLFLAILCHYMCLQTSVLFLIYFVIYASMLDITLLDFRRPLVFFFCLCFRSFWSYQWNIRKQMFLSLKWRIKDMLFIVIMYDCWWGLWCSDCKM